jgi:hypothetical protein
MLTNVSRRAVVAAGFAAACPALFAHAPEGTLRPEELVAFNRTELDKWTQLVKRSGAQVRLISTNQRLSRTQAPASIGGLPRLGLRRLRAPVPSCARRSGVSVRVDPLAFLDTKNAPSR